MLLIFRLPFTLLEMVLRRGLDIFGLVTGLLRGGGADDTVVPMPPREPAGRGAAGGPQYTATPEAAAPPPPPSAEEAIQRRQAREAAEAAAPPVREPEPPAPLRAVGEDGHVDREATVVESFGPDEEVHGQITVDEPWDGYASMPANAIVTRLRDSDEATKAVVRLYEQTHKKRQTVLRATG